MANPNLYTRIINAFSGSANDAPTVYQISNGQNITPTLIVLGSLNLYGYNIYNLNAYSIYLKFYDSVASPTVGSDIPTLNVQVPALGSVVLFGSDALANFSTGLWIAATKNYIYTDTTNIVSLCFPIIQFYKTN
jgi:hypothetical protein